MPLCCPYATAVVCRDQLWHSPAVCRSSLHCIAPGGGSGSVQLPCPHVSCMAVQMMACLLTACTSLKRSARYSREILEGEQKEFEAIAGQV